MQTFSQHKNITKTQQYTFQYNVSYEVLLYTVVIEHIGYEKQLTIDEGTFAALASVFTGKICVRRKKPGFLSTRMFYIKLPCYLHDFSILS